MASDAQLAKRDKYVLEGKVQVVWHSLENGGTASFRVSGSSPVPYEVVFRDNGWSCDCPAQKPECVHVLAAQLVSPLRSATDDVVLAPEDLDSLLG